MRYEEDDDQPNNHIYHLIYIIKYHISHIQSTISSKITDE